jgi:hypothetical protein
MSHAALARLSPADRDQLRAAVRLYEAGRTRRALAVGAAAVFGIAAIGVGFEVMGVAGVVFGVVVAIGLALLARFFVRMERERMFQQGFAGTGLAPDERASVLALLRADEGD